jgi:hypothetical protein
MCGHSFLINLLIIFFVSLFRTIADSDIELLNHDVMKMYANSLLDM